MTDNTVFDAALRGDISTAEAARQLGIPRTTLQDRINRAKHGPPEHDQAGTDDYPLEEVRVIVRHYEQNEKLYVYPMGDAHIGAAEHAGPAWAEWQRYLVSNPLATMLGTGDFLNCAIPGSKSDPHLERAPVGVARRAFTRSITPLAEEDRIDVLFPGNHENRVWRATGDCPIEVVSEALGVPYAPSVAVLIYYVGEQRYVFYARHGTGSAGNTAGSIANALAKSAQVLPSADVVLQGHAHHQVLDMIDHLRISNDQVEPTKQVRLCSGSFVGYARYAAERGWMPQHIGAPRIYLDGRRHDVHVSV